MVDPKGEHGIYEIERALAMAHHLAGFVLHRNDPGRMTDRAALREIAVRGNQPTKFILWAVDYELYFGILVDRLGHPGDDGRRAAVATHGVNGNDNAPGSPGFRGFRVRVLR